METNSPASTFSGRLLELTLPVVAYLVTTRILRSSRVSSAPRNKLLLVLPKILVQNEPLLPQSQTTLHVTTGKSVFTLLTKVFSKPYIIMYLFGESQKRRNQTEIPVQYVYHPEVGGQSTGHSNLEGSLERGGSGQESQ